jgi:hypothetical protein
MDHTLNFIIGEIFHSGATGLGDIGERGQFLRSIFDGIEAAAWKIFRDFNGSKTLLQFLS